VTQNLNVAKRFVGDRLSRRTAVSVDNLAAGEGHIASMDGQHVGVSRDEDGRVHVVSARCTHMGCIVNWNSAEQTWDCPCHGSRFAQDGTVLEGPAVTALEDRSGELHTLEGG